MCLCIGQLWADNNAAKALGRREGVHTVLLQLIAPESMDPDPQVRAAAVSSLGLFFGKSVVLEWVSAGPGLQTPGRALLSLLGPWG